LGPLLHGRVIKLATSYWLRPGPAPALFHHRSFSTCGTLKGSILRGAQNHSILLASIRLSCSIGIARRNAYRESEEAILRKSVELVEVRQGSSTSCPLDGRQCPPLVCQLVYGKDGLGPS
ncbi:unnamed protein product, partial [Nesidiocoris tenuis]